MKKIVFLICFFSMINNVIATSDGKVLCEYDVEPIIDPTFSIEYDANSKKYEFGVSQGLTSDGNKTEIVLGNYKHAGGPTTSYEYTIHLNDQSSFIELTSENCIDLYYCKYDVVSTGMMSKTTSYVHIFYDSLQYEDKKNELEGTYTCYSISKYVSEDTIGVCSKYTHIYDEIEDNLKNYNSTHNISYIENANKKIDQLGNLCNSITSYLDYDESCMTNCLNLTNDVNSLKKRYNISDDNIKTCGFSEKLIIWIANIIRWVKYIIPVAVIVLGILDFMKAMGADKDDEMKKAQGRFVKRLIAAALIFIAPLIIEFVLDKMGFDANGCGIINL